MEDNKELVTEVTENVEEQATEELVNGAKLEETVNTTENEATPEEKLYSEAELNERLDELLADKLKKKTAIIERKVRRELDSKYADDLELAYITKQGIGVEDSKEAKDRMRTFYKNKRIDIPEYQRNYSESELRILAQAEADEIIDSGLDEVVTEVDRLADKGLDNMTSREKIVFKQLAEYRQGKERENELLSIGAKDVLNNTEFNNFAKQFNTDVPIKDVYNMWTKTQPKPKVEQMGSMKNTAPNKVKDHYTEDEISRLSLDDLKNPDVWNAVRKSMTGQN
jgi:hypothetical protein